MCETQELQVVTAKTDLQPADAWGPWETVLVPLTRLCADPQASCHPQWSYSRQSETHQLIKPIALSFGLLC